MAGGRRGRGTWWVTLGDMSSARVSFCAPGYVELLRTSLSDVLRMKIKKTKSPTRKDGVRRTRVDNGDEGGVKPPLQLFELNQHDFGGGADAEGWAPGAGAAGGVDQEIAEALESVGVCAEDARGEPGEGKNLAAVGVTGKLQRDALLFGDGQRVRNVREQDAGARAVEIGVGEDGAEALGIRGVVIGDAEDLQAVEINGFVVEDTDAGIADGT